MTRTLTGAIRAGEATTKVAERLMQIDKPRVEVARYVDELAEAARFPKLDGEPNHYADAVGRWKGQIQRLGQGKDGTVGAYTMRSASQTLARDLRRAKGEQVDQIVNRWVLEKARYQARIVARNESVEAFRDVQLAGYAAQPWAHGVRWSLSSSHPRPDICDVLAAQNLHGLGAGGYPADKVPARHTSCLCLQSAIVDVDFFERELAKQTGDEPPPLPGAGEPRKTGNQYLRELDEAERRAIAGPTRSRLVMQGRSVMADDGEAFKPVWELIGADAPPARKVKLVDATQVIRADTASMVQPYEAIPEPAAPAVAARKAAPPPKPPKAPSSGAKAGVEAAKQKLAAEKAAKKAQADAIKAQRAAVKAAAEEAAAKLAAEAKAAEEAAAKLAERRASDAALSELSKTLENFTDDEVGAIWAKHYATAGKAAQKAYDEAVGDLLMKKAAKESATAAAEAFSASVPFTEAGAIDWTPIDEAWQHLTEEQKDAVHKAVFAAEKAQAAKAAAKIEAEVAAAKAAQLAAEEAAAAAKAAAKKITAAEKAKATKAAKKAAASADAVTLDGSAMVQIGPQKGSNPGGLFRDERTGEQWYVKFASDQEMARNEALAARLYKLAGIEAPEYKLTTIDGRQGLASRWMAGLSSDIDAITSGKVAGVADGFAVDAWLANWDVVGLGYDNLLIRDGKAVRVDTGGALRFRAQGGLKGAAFGNVVTEIDTLRDSYINHSAASVFGKLTDKQIEDSVARVLKVSDAEIRSAVEAIGPTDAAERAKLVDTLIARKADLAKRYPGAVAKAAGKKGAKKAAQGAAWKPHGKAGIPEQPKPRAENKTAAARLDLGSKQAETYAQARPKVADVIAANRKRIGPVHWEADDQERLGNVALEHLGLGHAEDRWAQAWYKSSRGPRAELGKALKRELDADAIASVARNVDFYDDHAKMAALPANQYAVTQEALYQRLTSPLPDDIDDYGEHITDLIDQDGYITLYRGINGYQARQAWADQRSSGKSPRVAVYSLSSWSTRKEIGNEFAGGGKGDRGDDGAILEMRVHISRVYTQWQQQSRAVGGYAREREWILAFPEEEVVPMRMHRTFETSEDAGTEPLKGPKP